MTPILWLLLFQRDPMRRFEELEKVNAAATRAVSEQQHRRAESEQMLLDKRFQKLVDALQRFANEYNKGRGQFWPLHEAEAVRRAYRDFERSLGPADRRSLP
ncbi:MAG TPA: hypothetical protein VGF16_01995 [Bryobacteraceae bacterium]